MLLENRHALDFSGAHTAYLRLCDTLIAIPNDDILDRPIELQDISLDLGGRFTPPVTENFGVKQILRDAVQTHANELVAAKERHGLYSDVGIHVGSDVTFTNKWKGRDPRIVLIFGDSFSEYRPLLLTGLIAETFEETRFVWSTNVDWNVVEEFSPDILITEIAERFMRQVPDDEGFSLASLVHRKMGRVEELLRQAAT